jgi:hypothetical protein
MNPNQREINAGTAALISLRDTNAPWALTDQRCVDMATAVLKAAADARAIANK